jgi:hypothetical protein
MVGRHVAAHLQSGQCAAGSGGLAGYRRTRPAAPNSRSCADPASQSGRCGPGIGGPLSRRTASCIDIKVQEGRNKVHWPDPYPATSKVDQGGTVVGISKRVGTYTVESGSLHKLFDIDVTEKDKGTLGQDDTGHGDVTFELKPNMKPDTKSATIDLYRRNMKRKNGKVKVTLSAQVF